MTTEPKHLARFEGGNALPEFRAAALLARLQGAVGADRVARGAPRPLGLERLGADARRHATGSRRCCATATRSPAAPPAATPTIVVAPRLGTISPWASKATDIARNCGLVVHRIERVTEYSLALKEPVIGAERALDAGERAAPRRCCTTA